ncbi:MAG: hypothetical protein ACFFFG_11980 [Candidatus Thorarchaeota archaeon]
MTSENRPIMYERITISPKRFVTVKLWPPSPHPEWGIARASIEIQESRVGANDEITYGDKVRLPCSGPTALVTTYLQQFLVEGRRLNLEFRNAAGEQDQDSLTDENELKELILTKLAGQGISKSRAYDVLTSQGYDIDKYTFYNTLEILANEGVIQKEEREHSESKNKYDWWVIPPMAEVGETEA